MGVFAIRGATTADSNTKQEIAKASIELFETIRKSNSLFCEELVYIHITTTQDITEYYPATALRLSGCDTPLFSSLEPKIKNFLPLCIRMLVLIDSKSKKKENIVNVYLKETKKLLKEEE